MRTNDRTYRDAIEALGVLRLLWADDGGGSVRTMVVKEDDRTRPATYGDAIEALGGLAGLLTILLKEGFLKVVVRQRGMNSHVMYEVSESDD